MEVGRILLITLHKDSEGLNPSALNMIPTAPILVLVTLTAPNLLDAAEVRELRSTDEAAMKSFAGYWIPQHDINNYYGTV